MTISINIIIISKISKISKKYQVIFDDISNNQISRFIFKNYFKKKKKFFFFCFVYYIELYPFLIEKSPLFL